jgi:hypothetical protein
MQPHRIAWEFEHGRAVPDGLCVCHSCDNPPCCNPGHLWIGTHADNAADKIRKGRGGYEYRKNRSGDNHPNSKLTWAKVREIRRLWALHTPFKDDGLTGNDLARRFGVKYSNVSMVIKHRTWKEAV